MDLYVLRHAIAADRELHARDDERPVTGEGLEKLRKITQAFAGLGVRVDAILSSPFVRARHTAEVVGEALGVVPIIVDALGAGADPGDFLRAIAEHASWAAAVMVVGHEPDLSGLISATISGDDGAAVRMKKAGLAKIALYDLGEPAHGELQWLLWPKHLVALGSV